MMEQKGRGEHRMGEDKNVFLTIMQNEQNRENDEIKVDFGIIVKHLKRLFALWLCLTLGLGCLSGALGLLAQKVLEEHAAKAMIFFPNTHYDVTKIKSPSVVGEALDAMGLDVLDMETFRNAVEIGGVIPTSSYEELSMYYDLLNQNTSNSLNVIQSLLSTNYDTSRYVISFNYSEAKLSQQDGVAFLNALLRSYQDYCMKIYNRDLSMGNPLSAIDYHEYDYAEAANIFSTTLDNATSYLASLESAAGTFRSTETGLTFQDLHRTANLLKSIDLDRLSSYIVIHSVSENNAEMEISYYRWRIETLEQQRNVQSTRFNALTDSIDNYQKDDILIISGTNGASIVSNSTDVNDSYDTMIQEKLDAQASIASYTRSISYYESVIDGFQTAETASRPEDIELVKGYLDSLNEKVNELIRNISLTANEYYETVAFSNEVRILIPSTAETPPLISRTTIKIVATVEALLFVAYCGVAFIAGLREANPRKKEQDPQPATV